jgi:hypothetical protein
LGFFQILSARAGRPLPERCAVTIAARRHGYSDDLIIILIAVELRGGDESMALNEPIVPTNSMAWNRTLLVAQLGHRAVSLMAGGSQQLPNSEREERHL